MNRAERRRQGQRQSKKAATYTLNAAQIEQIKEDATREAMNNALVLLFCIPVCALHDNYSSLMRKEVNGLSREERFAQLITEYYSRFDDGVFTLDELKEDMYKITGISFEVEK